MARPKKAGAAGAGKTTARRDINCSSKGRNCRSSDGRRPSSDSSGASYDATSTRKKPTTNRKKKMSSNGVQKAGGRRGAGRTAKKDRWSEEFLSTNPKSPVINVDLVKLLAHPDAWTCLDGADKKEIINLLPDHIHPAPDPDNPDAPIPPIQQEFLRYSNNWRDGVRQYQVDLEQGRYDSKWLRDAAQAMEERADGNFDRWKEEQFEQFWGQKQKLDYAVIAGESSKVKLQTLVEHGCVQVGDVWKYTRSFGKGSGGLLVEKEAKVIDSNGSSLTFAIPPGQRYFLCGTYDDKAQHSEATKKTAYPMKDSPYETSNDGWDAGVDVDAPSIVPDSSARDEEACPAAASEPTPAETNRKTRGNETKPMAVDSHGRDDVVDTSIENEEESSHDDITNQVQDCLGSDGSSELSTPPQSSPAPQAPPDMATRAGDMDDGAMDMDTPKDAQNSDINESNSLEGLKDTENKGDDMEPSEMTTTAAPKTRRPKGAKNEELKDIILQKVTGPQSLGNKILRIDGRVENPPNGNAWKDFRCYRNNQDIGSLWEVRQEWFARNKH